MSLSREEPSILHKRLARAAKQALIASWSYQNPHSRGISISPAPTQSGVPHAENLMRVPFVFFFFSRTKAESSTDRVRCHAHQSNLFFPYPQTMAEDAAAAAAAAANGTGEPKVSKNALKKQVGTNVLQWVP